MAIIIGFQPRSQGLSFCHLGDPGYEVDRVSAAKTKRQQTVSTLSTISNHVVRMR
jgi:hypothetical protein